MADVDLWSAAEGRVDDAVSLGELQEHRHLPAFASVVGSNDTAP